MTINMVPNQNGVAGVMGFDRRYRRIKDDWYTGELAHLYALSVALNMPKFLESRFGVEVSNVRDYGY